MPIGNINSNNFSGATKSIKQEAKDFQAINRKSWRPEGLQNPYPHSPFCGQPGAPCRACGWESGADAVLEILKKDAEYVKAGHCSEEQYICPDVNGYFCCIFIPDEGN